MRKAYGILVGKPAGKRSFWKCRHRCQENVNANLKERVLMFRLDSIA
jgi:hypothetical protein